MINYIISTFISFLIIFLFFFPVGYDDRRMMLGGSFTYDSENQRALPFTVKIKELSDAMKVFAGSSSKFYFNFT